MLTLYYSRKSCAYAPHILLHDAGAAFDTVEIDFATGEQTKPEFLAINPKGRVPALATPHGILTENPAILLYIAQTHPHTNLAPSDPFALARAQSFNMVLASTVHVAHSHKHRGARWADDPAAQAAMTAKVTENMAMYAAMIEEHYFTGPYVLGDDYSICDPYLALITQWLRADGVDLADFPKLQAHDALMRARPSMQAVMGLYD